MKLLPGIILWAALTASAFGELGSLVAFSITQTFDETRYETVVTRPEIDVTPSWDPEREPAPLAPHEAVALARTWLGEKFPDRDNWAPLHIETRNIQNSDKWYYVVAFHLYDEATFKILGDRFLVSVLMTGTIPQITSVQKR